MTPEFLHPLLSKALYYVLNALNTSKEQVRWGKVPSLTKWKQSSTHLSGYQVSSTSCSLLGHLSLSEFLGFWPNTVHLPSHTGKHSVTVNATHINPISPLWKAKKKNSTEMFSWNHELQGWVTSHLKNLAIQTSPPVIQSPGLQEQVHHPAAPPRSH